MIRRLATLLCSSVLLCCCAVPSQAASAEEQKLSREQQVTQARAALLEKDPEFAASETALTVAQEKFLALFSGPSLRWAKALLKKQTEGYANDITRLADGSAKRYRETFFKNRAETIRYMTLIIQIPFTDPDFFLLLRPVCLFSTYYSNDKILAETLAAFDARRENPAKPLPWLQSRRVGGEYWALGRLDEQKMRSSDGSDVNLAFVLRVTGGTFTVNPIIAPSAESYYPGEDSPLRMKENGSSTGPKKERISECELVNKLTVANAEGPFTFRVDAEQLFTGKELNYLCEPRCTGFTYTWSEKSKTYLRSPGVCRDDDGWRARSPFDGETLIPVAKYAQTISAAEPALRANEQAMTAAWAAFSALFDEKTQRYLQTEYANWHYDRQFALYRFTGKAKEFVDASVQIDKPVLEFMQRVAALAKTPDARLLVLLDPLHKKMTTPPDPRKDRYRQEEEDGGYYYRSELLNGKKQPLLTTRFAQQLQMLLPFRPGQKPDRGNPKPAYTATGLDGGPAIAFTYENPQNRYRGKQERLPEKTNAFSVTQGADGAHWGLTEQQFNPAVNAYYAERAGAERRITRIHNNKIGFVTPALPEEKAFFKKPELRQDRVVWAYPKTERRYYYGECDMVPAFVIDKTRAPFSLSAADIQTFDRREQERSWQCTPECGIPFTWDGSAYVPGAPICLPEGQWGVKEPAEKKK